MKYADPDKIEIKFGYILGKCRKNVCLDKINCQRLNCHPTRRNLNISVNLEVVYKSSLI